MCRNIRTLFNFEPPASEDEIRASALQFVRKLSGFNAPSRANAPAFERAVDEVTEAVRRLRQTRRRATARPRPRRPAPGRASAMREARPMDREGGANVQSRHGRLKRH
jgi:hypothetical protein